MKETKNIDGNHFAVNTPHELCLLLNRLNTDRKRYIFDYGDIKTNSSWNEKHETTGYIGRSTGTKPILLLIYNSRSLGGGPIVTDCIISITETKTKKQIYLNLIK